MSAWARIVAKASPDELRELSLALVEIQNEQSARYAHELAEELRQIEPDWDGDEDPWVVWNQAADSIDPKVAGSP